MEQKPNSRRKLLQGSLAAPVVLTVTSPSALAASSFNACIARGANEPPPSELVTSAKDNWYRAEFAAYKFRLNSGSDPANNPEYEYYYRNKGQEWRYYRLDICDSTGVLESDIYGIKSSLGNRYVLVWVDNDGKTVAYGSCGPNGGYAVSASCWNSFITQK
jgi:hypothetical protein